MAIKKNSLTSFRTNQMADWEQRRLNGEFDRRRLIRLGYLSVPERRRLRETYHDLDERFEPETHSWPLEKAFYTFIVYMLGFMVGTAGTNASR